MPPEAWGALGLLGGALIAGVVAWVRDRRQEKASAPANMATLALAVANSLREDLNRVTGRVESLERDRNAYRSWSHVLWSHIHNDGVPRVPAPNWPDDLAR